MLQMNLLWLVGSLLVVCGVLEGKKKGKDGLFSSDTLKCLVCQSLVEEIEFLINKVDPKKKIETGTFRLNSDGTQNKNIISYARSQTHLMEIVDSVCKTFEDYAQAKSKVSGKPMIIRIVTPEGNMNPQMGEVDMVPDDDLNTRLKFYCENIVEDQEDDIMELFSKEGKHNDIQLCSKRSSYCEDTEIPADEYEFEKEEL
ncbi:protein canopy homolog 2 isoform X2 [Eurytemora carolleeae]|uniref:protein canopy homolog 2 isoform X2 n=1 Tax=Eurytemora carolleeae TaxID=1294199 RepID=UPI000C775BFC|nr:protein canopy homolog 2 isoform X2 [Eurytemora carolleeae]|eukprot:XP_023336654.1 protein canopy homolog 2-like isoform X2 [Eurytemora affinis]